MADSTRDRIIKVLKTVTTKPLPEDPEESLFEGRLLDSFTLPDLVSALEAEFSVQVPDTFRIVSRRSHRGCGSRNEWRSGSASDSSG